MLVKLSRPVWYTLLPLTFLLTMTILALLFQLWEFYAQGKWFLLGLDLVILVAAHLRRRWRPCRPSCGKRRMPLRASGPAE